MAYLANNAIAVDQLLNTLLGGAPDETLSSRAHRMREKKQRFWGWTANAIDVVFYILASEIQHCRKSYEAEAKRRQLPPEFWPL